MERMQIYVGKLQTHIAARWSLPQVSVFSDPAPRSIPIGLRMVDADAEGCSHPEAATVIAEER